MYSEIEFESVIRSACGAIVKENVAVFDSFDVSCVEIDPKTTRKFKAALRSVLFKASKGYKALKITATACIVVFSILIGSVIVVPPIRAYVWEIITTWYEECINIKFKEDNSVDYPKSVKEVYLPKLVEGWTIRSSNPSGEETGSYIITTTSGEEIYYSQFTTIADISIDNSSHTVENVTLKNGNQAYLYIFSNNYKLLIWRDAYYYKLHSFDVSDSVLIEMANSIEK